VVGDIGGSRRDVRPLSIGERRRLLGWSGEQSNTEAPTDLGPVDYTKERSNGTRDEAFYVR
jgi:hypothetical protein